ncbi:MAG TPA: ATP-binding protein [Acidimicrobiales bacterium]|nr:ATP-binding protein [Acidimicrobiales bacterium]
MRVAPPTTTPDGTIKDCRRFTGSLSSVTTARRFVAEALVHVPKPLLEAVELMVSELASNCVMHAEAEFEVCIVRSAGALRVEVTDSGSGEPVLKHPDANDLRGRGLVIVKELADDWGVVRRAGQRGKMVWFAVRGT